MLIALFLSYVLSGDGAAFSGVLTTSTLEDLGDRVAAAVTDPTRAEMAATVLNSAREDVKAFEKSYVESGKNLTKYYRDHTQNGTMMTLEVDDLETHWEAAQTQVLALRFELKSQLTQEEWEQIFQR